MRLYLLFVTAVCVLFLKEMWPIDHICIFSIGLELQSRSKAFGTFVKFWAKSREFTVHASIVIWATRVLSLPFSRLFPPDNVETCERSMNGSWFRAPWKINIVLGGRGKSGNCRNSFDQAPVVQTMDSAIRQINHCPLDDSIDFASVYPLDSDLSRG